MTDEELGRAWCGRHEKRPDKRPENGVCWYETFVLGQCRADEIPEWLSRSVPGEVAGWYPSEAAAYAALGAALRKIVVFADGVREVMPS